MNVLFFTDQGKYLVKTKHSEYVFDLDAVTAKRIAGKDANRWHDEDVTYNLLAFDTIEVGESMHLVVEHEDLWVHSTPVVSIEPIWEDAA